MNICLPKNFNRAVASWELLGNAAKTVLTKASFQKKHFHGETPFTKGFNAVWALDAVNSIQLFEVLP
jgi:hypothetical protein